MKAQYIGKDFGGFKRNCIYEIYSKIEPVRKLGNSPEKDTMHIVIYDKNSKSFIPYKDLETLSQNWILFR